MPQIIGITGMGFALFYNFPSAELANKVCLNSAILVGVSVIYASFRVKYKMKKRLFEAEPIEEALAD